MPNPHKADFRELVLALDEWKLNCDDRLSKEVFELLEEIWDFLDGSDVTSMNTSKLRRHEKPEWSSPVLSFRIERHGGTVNGSTRAEMYSWSVNLKTGKAECRRDGHRQLLAQSPRYNPEPDCIEIVEHIRMNQDHESLKWSDDRLKVKVEISRVVPCGNSKQTEADRRKRFRKVLEPLLSEIGWTISPTGAPNTYIKAE